MATNAIRANFEDLKPLLNAQKENVQNVIDLLGRLSAACNELKNDDKVEDATMETLANKFEEIARPLKEFPETLDQVSATLQKKSEEMDDAVTSGIHEIKDKMEEYMTAFKMTAKKINDEVDVFDDENKEWLEGVFAPIEQAMLIVEEKFGACGNAIDKLVDVASDVHARAKAGMGTAQDSATAAKNQLN